MLILWKAWLEIAATHASLARARRPSPEVVDAFSRDLHEEESVPVPPREPSEGSEAAAALIAITASAFAIDGFYGTVRGLIDPPKSGAARQRQIVECLKHGFVVGAEAHRWQADLDWLFAIKDNSVHHSEIWEEMVVVEETGETVVFGGASDFDFSADSAARAHKIVSGVIGRCLCNPKPSTTAWVERTLLDGWSPGPG